MQAHYPFVLQALPYELDELEPYLSREVLYYHYKKHLQAYINKLNTALEPYPAFHNWTLVQLLTNIEALPTQIRKQVKTNAGGVYNHQFYFNCMQPPCEEEPQGMIRKWIEDSFRSFEGFKNIMTNMGLSLVGSGWTWLVKADNNQLQLINTVNQDTPNLNQYLPLILVDVWEHAYYLQYKNERGEYLDNWFKLINWSRIQV